jgi:hypothetical protein
MTKRLLLALTGILLLGSSSTAQARFLIEGFLGTAYSFPSTVTIYQENQPNLVFSGHWINETFKNAPYYSIRLGGWTETSGWEFEDIHHKVVLDNNPANVQALKATFGFNFFLLNRAWDLNWFILRVGGGPVIAHPITTVRGQQFNSAEGGILGTTYFLVGAGVQLSLQRRFYFGKHFFLTAEGKMTMAWANLPVVGGSAHIFNFALHGLGGFGYRF